MSRRNGAIVAVLGVLLSLVGLLLSPESAGFNVSVPYVLYGLGLGLSLGAALPWLVNDRAARLWDLWAVPAERLHEKLAELEAQRVAARLAVLEGEEPAPLNQMREAVLQYAIELFQDIYPPRRNGEGEGHGA